MRIIGGDFRATRLQAPKGLNTRPTLDRIRESLFNILGQNFSGGIVLDLFAGSGCNGLEFISRGIDFVYFVDNSQESINVMIKNIKKCKVEEKSKIIKMDFQNALKSFKSDTFSYIYMDPPFNKIDYYSESFEIIRNKKLLKEDGSLIIEHSSDKILKIPGGYKEIRYKKYGKTSLSIWSLIDESNICGKF